MTQTEIPGTEDPSRIPSVDARLAAWLEAKERAKEASDAKKQAEHLLLVELGDLGIDRYAYTDATGKRRLFVADKTPKAKTITAPSRKQEGRSRVNAAVEKLRDAIPKGATLELRAGGKTAKLESRRVKRTKAHDVAADPFAATRAGLLAEAEAEAEAKQDGTP